MVIYGMSENIFVFSPLFFSFPFLHIPRSPKGNVNQKKKEKKRDGVFPSNFRGFFRNPRPRWTKGERYVLSPSSDPPPSGVTAPPLSVCTLPRPLTRLLPPPSRPRATKDRKRKRRGRTLFFPLGSRQLGRQGLPKEEEEERGRSVQGAVGEGRVDGEGR